MSEEFPDIPYMDSFQRGILIRSTDPLRSAWRQVAKLGTSDRLAAVAAKKGHDQTIAKSASIRVGQALELWESSKHTSVLTRPLLLYYSMLNLARGVMLAYVGEIGAHSHGLSFRSGKSLLECSAIVGKKEDGTFPKFARSLGMKRSLAGASFTLKELLASVPELLPDFPLFRCGPSSVARVNVDALIDGPVLLHFGLHKTDASSFAENWTSLLPDLREVCTYERGVTLRVTKELSDEEEIAAFCRRYLTHNLRKMDDAFWFADLQRDARPGLHRILRYLAAMFILSNVTRYEPDYLEEYAAGLTDAGFALESFLDSAERFFPQLVAGVLMRKPVFFE